MAERKRFCCGLSYRGHIWNYANGNDPSEVISEPEKLKGYSNSTTLENDIRKVEQAYKVLLELADSVARRMRADGMKAFCVAVTIRYNDFRDRSHQKTLLNPTDISMEVHQISKKLFDELWDKETPIRLLGISLTDLTADDTPQLSLFQDDRREKARKLDKAYDAINNKFGSATIKRGTNLKTDASVGAKHRAQIDLKNENK